MGFCISRTPNYLYQHSSGYYFRYRVPQDLKPSVGKTEFRCSLWTRFLSTAKSRARAIAGFIQELFKKIRKGLSRNMNELSQEKINELIRYYINTVLEVEESEKVMSDPLPDYVIEELMMGHDEMHQVLKHAISRSEHSYIENVVDALLDDRNIKLDKESYSYKLLSRELMKSLVGVFTLMGERELKNKSVPFFLLCPSVIQQLKMQHVDGW